MRNAIIQSNQHCDLVVCVIVATEFVCITVAQHNICVGFPFIKIIQNGECLLLNLEKFYLQFFFFFGRDFFNRERNNKNEWKMNSIYMQMDGLFFSDFSFEMEFLFESK